MSKNKNNPGSKEAIKNGCLCPIYDNNHGNGLGYKDENGKEMFYINQDCPLHGIERK